MVMSVSKLLGDRQINKHMQFTNTVLKKELFLLNMWMTVTSSDVSQTSVLKIMFYFHCMSSISKEGTKFLMIFGYQLQAQLSKLAYSVTCHENRTLLLVYKLHPS